MLDSLEQGLVLGEAMGVVGFAPGLEVELVFEVEGVQGLGADVLLLLQQVGEPGAPEQGF